MAIPLPSFLLSSSVLDPTPSFSLPPTIHLLYPPQTGNLHAKEAAAGALGNLALNLDNQYLISDAGAIPVLINLLETGDDGAKEHSAGALWYLAAAPENKQIIHAQGGIKPLIKEVIHGNVHGRETATGALWYAPLHYALDCT
jgi:hypothetical protein